MKCIIFGGRNFNDWEYLKIFMDEVYTHVNITHVISGKARGADTLGEQWAKLNDIPIIECPADWNKYGKRAGYLRNTEMGAIADIAAGFNGGSGTQMMFDIMDRLQKPVFDART